VSKSGSDDDFSEVFEVFDDVLVGFLQNSKVGIDEKLSLCAKCKR